MDNNPFPLLNVWLLVSLVVSTLGIAVMAIYGLWISWLTRTRIDNLSSEIKHLVDANKQANKNIFELNSRLDRIPDLIVKIPAPKTISS